MRNVPSSTNEQIASKRDNSLGLGKGRTWPVNRTETKANARRTPSAARRSVTSAAGERIPAIVAASRAQRGKAPLPVRARASHAPEEQASNLADGTLGAPMSERLRTVFATIAV